MMLQDDDKSGAKMSKEKGHCSSDSSNGWNFGKYGSDKHTPSASCVCSYQAKYLQIATLHKLECISQGLDDGRHFLQLP